MNAELPDIGRFERRVYRKRKVLAYLLSFARAVTGARMAGLVYGTDGSLKRFLPPGQWDRGVIHKFSGQGPEGWFFKWFGPAMVRMKGLSPVFLYRMGAPGQRINADGVVAYILRHHQAVFHSGINILLIDVKDQPDRAGPGGFVGVAATAYDGKGFKRLSDIRTNTDIVYRFRAENYVSAYVPDYGAIVLNTIDPHLMARSGRTFVNEPLLRERLDMLMAAIKAASVAYLGTAQTREARQLLRRKEKELRTQTERLREKEAQLDEQKHYLMAVGAVTADQLQMPPTSCSDGVYAFLDMASSVRISQQLSPRDYLTLLNYCHEVIADNAQRYGCRVDTFMGDGVFLETVSVFDSGIYTPGLGERLMLMTCLIASVFNDIFRLKQGMHAMDPEKRFAALVNAHRVSVSFRAGMTHGNARIGPIGSMRRRAVTAIGEAVARASRLESTGKPDHIHTTPEDFRILDNAVVTDQTKMICQVLNPDNASARDTGAFLDLYCDRFKVDLSDLLVNQETRHKEFAMTGTQLIPCLPAGPIVTTCAGI